MTSSVNFFKILFLSFVAFFAVEKAYSALVPNEQPVKVVNHIQQLDQPAIGIAGLSFLAIANHSRDAGIRNNNWNSGQRYNDIAAYLVRQTDPGSVSGQELLLEGKAWLKKNNPDRAMPLLNEAMNYADKNGLYKLRADIDVALGQYTGTEGENIDKKNRYYKDAFLNYKKANAVKEQGEVLQSLGAIARLKEDYGKSIDLLERSLIAFHKTGYPDLQADYELLCDDYKQKGDFPAALQNGLLAIRSAEAVGRDINSKTALYNRVALIYYNLGTYDTAFLYFKKARSYAEKFKDTASIYQLTVNMSNLLLKGKNAGEALNLLKKTQAQFPVNIADYQLHISDLYLRSYIELKDHDKAQALYGLMLNYLNQFSDKNDSRHILVSKDIAGYLLSVGQYKKASPYIDSLQAASFRIHVALKQSPTELDFFRADSAIGKFKDPMIHWQKNKILNDTLFNNDKTRQFDNLKLEVDGAKKDNDIHSLQKASVLQNATIMHEESTRKIILGAIVFLFFLLLLAYYRYRLKKLINIELQKKQHEINIQNELLKKLLVEKEWLIREIHHRVKNNLQIVISLLNTQSKFLENDDAVSAIKNSQHRMHAMSLIHQKLYQSNNLACIDMQWYIKELVDYMGTSFGIDRTIQFVLDTQKIVLDVAQAVPLGLILNEAITNSIKYAFSVTQPGKIRITLWEIPGSICRLSIADDGIGLPDNFDPEGTRSMGMNLMKGLSEQLDGYLTMSKSPGLTVTIEFNRFINNELELTDKSMVNIRQQHQPGKN